MHDKLISKLVLFGMSLNALSVDALGRPVAQGLLFEGQDKNNFDFAFAAEYESDMAGAIAEIAAKTRRGYKDWIKKDLGQDYTAHQDNIDHLVQHLGEHANQLNFSQKELLEVGSLTSLSDLIVDRLVLLSGGEQLLDDKTRIFKHIVLTLVAGVYLLMRKEAVFTLKLPNYLDHVFLLRCFAPPVIAANPDAPNHIVNGILMRAIESASFSVSQLPKAVRYGCDHVRNTMDNITTILSENSFSSQIEKLLRDVLTQLGATPQSEINGAFDKLREARHAYKYESESEYLVKNDILWLLMMAEGDLAQASFDHDSAADHYDAAFRVAKDGSREQRWRSRMAKGDCLRRFGRMQNKPQLVRNAVRAYESARDNCADQTMAHELATTQVKIGSTYKVLSRLSDGEEKTSYLRRAGEAYDAALTGMDYDAVPVQRALLYLEKASLYVDLAQRIQGAKKHTYIEESLDACDVAAAIYEKTNETDRWSHAIVQKGVTMQAKAQMCDPDDREPVLRDSIALFDKALRVVEREKSPARWGSILSMKAASQELLGRGAEGPRGDMYIKDAIQSLDTASNLPVELGGRREWANRVVHAAEMRAYLGFRQESQPARARALTEALEAYDAVGEQVDEHTFYHEWQKLVSGRANVLADLALADPKNPSRALLERSIKDFDSLLPHVGKSKNQKHFAALILNRASAARALGEILGNDEGLRILKQADQDLARAISAFDKLKLNRATEIAKKNALEVAQAISRIESVH